MFLGRTKGKNDKEEETKSHSKEGMIINVSMDSLVSDVFEH